MGEQIKEKKKKEKCVFRYHFVNSDIDSVLSSEHRHTYAHSYTHIHRVLFPMFRLAELCKDVIKL